MDNAATGCGQTTWYAGVPRYGRWSAGAMSRRTGRLGRGYGWPHRLCRLGFRVWRGRRSGLCPTAGRAVHRSGGMCRTMRTAGRDTGLVWPGRPRPTAVRRRPPPRVAAAPARDPHRLAASRRPAIRPAVIPSPRDPACRDPSAHEPRPPRPRLVPRPVGSRYQPAAAPARRDPSARGTARRDLSAPRRRPVASRRPAIAARRDPWAPRRRPGMPPRRERSDRGGGGRGQPARLTALVTARSDAVVMLASMPTPQMVVPPTSHSTYAAATASPPEVSACSA